MGDVVTLRIPRPRATPPAAAGSAEILFFTGVRYERMIAAAESHDPRDEPRGAGGRRRRGPAAPRRRESTGP